MASGGSFFSFCTTNTATHRSELGQREFVSSLSLLSVLHQRYEIQKVHLAACLVPKHRNRVFKEHLTAPSAHDTDLVNLGSG